MAKYAIWNKQDMILTPIGEVLTAKQWIERYPIAGLDSITVVCAGGEINGAFFSTLGQMIEIFEKQGVDFSRCVTNEDKLQAIEDFEIAKELEVTQTISPEEITATALTSIAASMEYQNMMTFDDVEEV